MPRALYSVGKYASVDLSRRGGKVLTKLSRDENEGAYRSGEGGEESAYSDPGSESRLKNGRRRKKTCVDIRWGEPGKKKKTAVDSNQYTGLQDCTEYWPSQNDVDGFL